LFLIHRCCRFERPCGQMACVLFPVYMLSLCRAHAKQWMMMMMMIIIIIIN
jgi:hypothetical protein